MTMRSCNPLSGCSLRQPEFFETFKEFFLFSFYRRLTGGRESRYEEKEILKAQIIQEEYSYESK